MNIETDDYRLPSHWASALINADLSGMEDDEIKQMNETLEGLGLWRHKCLDVADDESFQQCPSYIHSSYGLLAGSYSTYTFVVS